MTGSEERAAVLEKAATAIRACTLCRLHVSRTNAVPGEGPVDARLFLVGEAPGRQEDESGRPFSGSAGEILNRALKSARIPRESVFITNIVKCRPPANRAPRMDEIETCRPYLMTQITAVQPKVVVTLGSTALRGLLGSGADLRSSRGKSLFVESIPVFPTYHPAAILYNRRLEAALRNDLRKAAQMVRPERARMRSAPPRTGRPTRPATSSGAVVMNAEGRILLLRRADEDIWCLPKGTVEPGETLEEAALREVREETGLEVRLVRPLNEVHYSFYWPPEGTNVAKTVTYFLAVPVRGELRPEEGFDEGRWVTRAEAMRLLHWQNDKDVVRRAFEVMPPRRR